MTRYFSKKFKTLNHNYLFQLNKYLKKSFNDSILIPAYSKKSIGKTNQSAMFKYRDGEIYLLCSQNFHNKELLGKIQDKLLYYLKKENFDFDYALIPVMNQTGAFEKK
jgi:hypothetical protein